MTMPGAEENGEDCAKCKPLEKKVRGAPPLAIACALCVKRVCSSLGQTAVRQPAYAEHGSDKRAARWVVSFTTRVYPRG